MVCFLVLRENKKFVNKQQGTRYEESTIVNTVNLN